MLDKQIQQNIFADLRWTSLSRTKDRTKTSDNLHVDFSRSINTTDINTTNINTTNIDINAKTKTNTNTRLEKTFLSGGQRFVE